MNSIDAKNSFWDDKKWFLKAQDNLERFWNEEVLSAYMLHFTIHAGQKNSKSGNWP